jgi:hypothetical protein
VGGIQRHQNVVVEVLFRLDGLCFEHRLAIEFDV